MDRESVFRGLMEEVREQVEARGGTLTASPPATEAALAALPFELPPSYRAFMKLWGGVSAAGGDLTGDELRILTPEEVVADTAALVHLPEGVEWEDEEGRSVEITTSHLIAFAVADAEARWCFCIDAQTRDGELPVYYHHQEEALTARDAATGEWVEDEGIEPDFPDFTAWLRDYVEGFLSMLDC